MSLADLYALWTLLGAALEVPDLTDAWAEIGAVRARIAGELAEYGHDVS